ncbi:unnamed protein product [Mytilus edulis]|uniref:Uncharacterized protein n=1 Tax=Mytilus edulis TaxID=6550 RepID=A0A8S3PSE3_MYTED|nr:unnamed protein product [Mytilus edulis]
MEKMNFIQNGWTMLPIDFFYSFENNTLRNIEFSDNKFINFNCKLLSQFSKIEKLTVKNNEIVFLHASGLHSVKELILTANNLFEIPNFCSNVTGQSLVPKLYRLDLTENAIRKLHPTSFMCLENLRYLILDKNRLAVLENNIFSRLTKLNTLSISWIPHLSIIKPKAFRCHSLKVLRFVNNRFHFDKEKNNQKKYLYDSSKLFKYTPSLRELNFENNHMPKDPAIFRKIFFPLSNLTKLILQATYIATLPERVFQQMPF